MASSPLLSGVYTGARRAPPPPPPTYGDDDDLSFQAASTPLRASNRSGAAVDTSTFPNPLSAYAADSLDWVVSSVKNIVTQLYVDSPAIFAAGAMAYGVAHLALPVNIEPINGATLVVIASAVYSVARAIANQAFTYHRPDSWKWEQTIVVLQTGLATYGITRYFNMKLPDIRGLITVATMTGVVKYAQNIFFKDSRDLNLFEKVVRTVVAESPATAAAGALAYVVSLLPLPLHLDPMKSATLVLLASAVTSAVTRLVGELYDPEELVQNWPGAMVLTLSAAATYGIARISGLQLPDPRGLAALAALTGLVKYVQHVWETNDHSMKRVVKDLGKQLFKDSPVIVGAGLLAYAAQHAPILMGRQPFVDPLNGAAFAVVFAAASSALEIAVNKLPTNTKEFWKKTVVLLGSAGFSYGITQPWTVPTPQRAAGVFAAAVITLLAQWAHAPKPARRYDYEAISITTRN